jgi:hypothetical protein
VLRSDTLRRLRRELRKIAIFMPKRNIRDTYHNSHHLKLLLGKLNIYMSLLHICRLFTVGYLSS